jgi:hypothetical protein
MILGFKKKFPWGEETKFDAKILQSAQEGIVIFPGLGLLDPKKHTIREGQRFKGGEWLHMATGVRTKQYFQFNTGVEQLAKCRATQRFDLSFRNRDVVALYIDKDLKYCKNRDHVFEIEPGWMDQFAKNDGFTDQEQFFRWFKKPVRRGQIIHWTDLKY